MFGSVEVVFTNFVEGDIQIGNDGIRFMLLHLSKLKNEERIFNSNFQQLGTKFF